MSQQLRPTLTESTPYAGLRVGPHGFVGLEPVTLEYERLGYGIVIAQALRPARSLN